MKPPLRFLVIVPIWLAGFASPALRADCLPAPPGLVAWWRMDEASLDVAEDVLGMSPASLTNTTSVAGAYVVTNAINSPVRSYRLRKP